MDNRKKYIILGIVTVLLMVLIVFLIGRSFGFFKYIKIGDIANVITINGIKVDIENPENDALNLENAYPMSDEEGMSLTPFVFTMTNTSNKVLSYTLRVVNDEDKQLSCTLEDQTICPALTTNYIKYSYKKNDGTYSEPSLLSNKDNIITTGFIAGGETITSSIVIWIDSEASNEIQNHYFFGKVIITGEQYIEKNLKETILAENSIVESEPTLDDISYNVNENGLYKSTATNKGDPTYYFRGNIENNYVEFAGFAWRIVRINEDGTIRLIMQDGINNNTAYQFSSVDTSKDNMYYSNSDIAKPALEEWYQINIVNKGYASEIANGNYFCEEARVVYNSDNIANSGANMTLYSSYTPNFMCEKNGKDGNGKGYVSGSVGLITYDELVHAGGKYNKINEEYYIAGNNTFTMSPAGFTGTNVRKWFVGDAGSINGTANTTKQIRPVINLKADTTVYGDGTSTNPYNVIIDRQKQKNFKEAILAENILNESKATLSKTSKEANENGLYKSTATNSGDPTYYFRGNVENNYVEFAGLTWRIVRINEDGTIRLIWQYGINNNSKYPINSVNDIKDNMYYSNSDGAKETLEEWYSIKIANNVNYSQRVVSGNYFCEEAKVSYSNDYISQSGTGMELYNSYTPNFMCENNGKDGNNKGYVPGSVGLITYDEVVHAGGYYNKGNDSYYLYNYNVFWTMSPAGFSGELANIWGVNTAGTMYGYKVTNTYNLRPVINLKADTVVTGNGISTNPYKVVTNNKTYY